MSCSLCCFFVTMAFDLIFRGADLLLAQGCLVWPLGRSLAMKISSSTADWSTVPTSADAAAARPVAPVITSGLS